MAEVMETIERAMFVPDSRAAYVDNPMLIGFNATISAPHMHHRCLQLLEKKLQPGMHALDVGSGNGLHSRRITALHECGRCILVIGGITKGCCPCSDGRTIFDGIAYCTTIPISIRKSGEGGLAEIGGALYGRNAKS